MAHDMVDLKEYIKNISETACTEKSMPAKIVAFFLDNDWFGIRPTMQGGKLLLDHNQIETISQPLQVFLHEEGTSENLFTKLGSVFPLTLEYFKKFCNEEKLSEETMFYLADFLLFRMEKDIVLYRDSEIEVLLKDAAMDLIKAHGNVLTFFLAWLRTKTKTAYCRDYVMEKRYSMTIQNEAYSLDEFLELSYYLFNEGYCEENDMYRKAAESKNYTDTWLFLSVHFICALRYTDLQRIYHPDLPCSAEEVIQKIATGTFTPAEAREVLLSITDRLCKLPLYPNKTDGTSGVSSIKFVVPASCEEHFGRLFALAEAHRQLNGTADSPIIRKISSYAEISRYMGDEIGGLFLTSDFRSRSATKSYLQAIHMMTDDILGEDNDAPHVKGYILAAMARSHKGSYGDFAGMTFEYLKDARFNGMTPQFAAFELFERGVLSFIPGLLLKIVTGGEFTNVSAQKQTSILKCLDLKPAEVESFVGIVEKGRRKAENALSQVLTRDVDVMEALHRIGSGQAFSKQAESLCLLSAINKLCPFDSTRQCVGCQYEISTKSTFFLLVSELKRISVLLRATSNPKEEEKYKQLLRTVLIPKLDEMLFCIKDQYGEDIFSQYEEFMKENLS